MSWGSSRWGTSGTAYRPGRARARRALGTAALLAGSLAVAAGAAPAGAQVDDAAGAAADAYALDIDVSILGNVAVDHGPFARATQDYPPGAEDPAVAQVLGTGPIPATGALVQNVGVLTSSAEALDTPKATAISQAVDVRLFSQNGTPLLTAAAVKAQSTTDCESDPSAAGTEFVDLRLATQTDPIPNPAPNTELAPQIFNPLGLRVILNEQHPTADGRGLVVNAIHIYHRGDPAVPAPLFLGDIVVAHAMSTVSCPGGPGSTGDDNDIVIVKEADTETASAGDTVTYEATVQNASDTDCLVTRLIEHMPVAFELTSTAGDFGDTAASVNRPGGGVDLVLEPEDLVIPAGESATQTFVLKVKEDAAPGVYFNNVELFCGNLGNWVKGLDAPVEVVAAQTPTTTTTTTTTPPADEMPARELAETGGWWAFGAGGGAMALGLVLAAARRAARRPLG